MTPERQQKIDELHKRSNRVLEIAVGSLMLLGISILLKPLLAALGFDMENYACFAIIKAIYKYTGIVLGIISILAICVTGILSFWATDDEKEQRKEEIREALREEQEAQAKKKRDYMPPRETPLIGLSEKQEGIINSFLLDIPIVKGHLKTSELIQILRALAGQGDLDDSDKDALIYWVEKVTGKEVDVRNFKYDYDSKFSEKGVIKWGNVIRAKFDAIENS